VSGSAFGFNVGADVGYRVTPTVSLGGLLRFARGSTTLDAGSGNEADLSAGGLMAGGGIRFRF
jgi:hypothetical protein